MLTIEKDITGMDDDTLTDSQRVDLLQVEAAEKAERIGTFNDRFHSMIERAIKAGQIQNNGEAKRRLEVVDTVTQGHDDIRLDTMEDDGVLGYNTIGAGRPGIHLNRGILTEIDSDNERKPVMQVIAHEEAHGDQVPLQGEFIIDGHEIDPLLLLEGHAEVNGNEGAGMGIAEHRDGQPQEVYAEGQDIAVTIIQKVGRDVFERVMTETGDVSELQR